MDEFNEVVTTPQEVTDVAQETTEQTTQFTTEQAPQQEEPKFKLKVNGDEMELPYSEIVKVGQKGLDYDRIRSKYEDSKPVVGFVEKLAQQNNMTVPEYLKAVEAYERQQEIENIATQRNLDPELAEELYLSRQERKARQEQEAQRQQADREKQEYLDFLNEFPEIQKPEDVPSEVWEIKRNNPNLSITDAYIRHERAQLKAKLTAQETNKLNAESSTGSVTGNGSPKSMTLTPEMIDSMTDKERMARWPEIKKVLGMK